MMTMNVGSTAVDFFAGDRLAGRYVVGDAFKPHVHPLNTPKGHTLSLVAPHDHKHHKGLMYALRTRDVNFWEERSVSPDEVPGKERHERFVSITEAGDTVGFDEDLTWLALDDSLVTFQERRSLSCRELPHHAGYEWVWSTQLEVQRDIELVMSQWSAAREDGTLVNYHGFGIRFRRDFGCTGGNALLLDGHPRSFEDGMGSTPKVAEFHGSLDGWPVHRAGLRMRQEQQNALFVMETPFAFMSMGPTNLAPLQLTQGQEIIERYRITVFDLPNG